MQLHEIIQKIRHSHSEFMHQFENMHEKDFYHAPENKWNAGQHLDHILRSVSPLPLVLSLPNFISGLAFGKANRPSKTYDELVKKYRTKLAGGAQATGRFIPKAIAFQNKDDLLQRLNKNVDKLEKKLNRYNEDQLDKLVIPHPFLGKLTLREMMYFTIYHVKHHQRLILEG